MDWRNYIYSFRRWARSPLFWVFLAIGALRIGYGFYVPVYTTDTLRNLGYGLEFRHYGFRVYEMTPYDFSPENYQYFWPNHHYTYPAVTLLFFVLVAHLWAALVFAKWVITGIEFANTWLVYKITGDRWCALLYFCQPDSIWFASHEGQFEPLVNLFMLIAMWLLQKKRSSAFLFLVLGVQTKLFPIFLLPWFLYQAIQTDAKKWEGKDPAEPFSLIRITRRFFLLTNWRFVIHSLVWGLVGLIPSGLAIANSHYLSNLFLPSYVPKTNTVSWALFDTGLHAFTPMWMIFTHFTAAVFFLAAILYFMRTEQKFLPYFAPLIFVTFVKSTPIGQFWYMILTPALCIPVENPKHRRILLAIGMAFGFRSLYSILIGPIGYRNPPPTMDVLQDCMYGI